MWIHHLFPITEILVNQKWYMYITLIHAKLHFSYIIFSNHKQFSHIKFMHDYYLHIKHLRNISILQHTNMGDEKSASCGNASLSGKFTCQLRQNQVIWRIVDDLIMAAIYTTKICVLQLSTLFDLTAKCSILFQFVHHLRKRNRSNLVPVDYNLSKWFLIISRNPSM